MKSLFAAICAILCISAQAFPVTDRICLNNCMGSGQTFQMCEQRCTFESSPADQQRQVIIVVPPQQQYMQANTTPQPPMPKPYIPNVDTSIYNNLRQNK